MPFIGIFAWDQFTSAIPQSQLDSATQANPPGSPGYNSGAYTWVGETVTFNGGAPVQIDIDDDDDQFEDAYVETGGAQTLAADVVIGGVTYTAGSVVQNEFALIDENGIEYYVVRIGSVNVGLAVSSTSGLTEPPATFDITDSLDGDPADNAGGVGSSSSPYQDIACFTAGTRILTRRGEVPVEALRPGDRLPTYDNGTQTLVGISVQRLGAATLLQHPSLRPVRVDRQCFDQPEHILLSPTHCLLHRSARSEFLFTAPEVLVRARHLQDAGHAQERLPRDGVPYYHLLFAAHELVLANGYWSESYLNTGTRADQPTDATWEIIEGTLADWRHRHASRTILKSHEVAVLFGTRPRRKTVEPDAITPARICHLPRKGRPHLRLVAE